MGDELTTIASVGAGTMAAAMAADAWRAVRAGIIRVFRLAFRGRGTASSPVRVAATGQEPAPETPTEDSRGRYVQTNLALGGDVFAVQRGDMTVRMRAGQHKAASDRLNGG
jgi:hypothetical protein